MARVSLKNKILLISIGSIIVISVLFTQQTYSKISAQSDTLQRDATVELKESSISKLELKNRIAGEQIQAYVEKNLDVAKVVAAQLSDNLTLSNPLSREQILRLIESAKRNAPHASVLYTFFEPNAFDNKDSEYVGKDTHVSAKDDGSFAVTVAATESGEITHYPIENSQIKYIDDKDDHGQRIAEWYLCPKETQKICIVEPYMFGLPKLLLYLLEATINPF